MRNLLVSSQHRILGRSMVAEHMFGSAEVLVAAVKLTELDGIEQIDAPSGVHYIHILFDRHEVIDVDGALVESLLIAEQSEKLMNDQDILTGQIDFKLDPMVPARPLVEGKRCKTLIQRLVKNKKAFVSENSYTDIRSVGIKVHKVLQQSGLLIEISSVSCGFRLPTGQQKTKLLSGG